ncbi:CUB and sushi domain-containing protein 3-like isoform X2 [Dreissena polymorpha]|uniref:CUB and sushi domain-containing protein 3-like isoform X2 n=1 Tax=Dreissena polymorpha TaxID=45954 RepID=UPI002263E591|nr:CUB and sushi domain-containing protein 3-like isoform X2 [Dreissena polymorpha]
MHQTIISILTGFLCVCTVTISTSTSSTTATSSTPWTSASSSLETLSGSGLPTTSKAETVLKCLNMIELVNGNVTITADGKLANYTCHDGYRLNGSEIRTCVNSTWSGYDPSCLKNCIIPLAPANGNVSFSALNTNATFTCIPGFFLYGSSQITCGDGKWSAAIPTCSRKDSTNGTTTYSETTTTTYNETETTASSTIYTETITTEDRPTSAQSVITPTTSVSPKETSTSIGPLSTTATLDCGNLTAPGNGSLIQNGSLYESVVDYTCNNGYYIVGTRTRTCLDSGRWSGQTPTCARVAVSTCTCKNDTDIWGVAWYESLCGQTQRSQCPKGSSGNYTRQCGSEGVWVNLTNTCIREAINNIASTVR